MFEIGIEGAAGVTAMDCNTAAFTVKVAVALWPPMVAVMTDVPLATAVVSPAAEIVAIAGLAEVQTMPGATVTS